MAVVLFLLVPNDSMEVILRITFSFKACLNMFQYIIEQKG